MVVGIIASILGGIITLIIVGALWRFFVPWLRRKLRVNIDLRGTWVTAWEWHSSTGQATDEIKIDWQSGNEVSGERVFFCEPPDSYKFRGFYKDGLLVGYYWSADIRRRYGGVMILRLDDKGVTLTGKLMYPEDGNLARLAASNINSYERETSL